MKRICVVTGSRAEYGLLRWLMHGIVASPSLQLQLIVTGMHLSPEFGLTIQEIERDGFSVDRKIEMLLSSDSSTGVVKSMGLGMIGFADALAQIQPDLLVVLGDRFEIFVAAASAMVSRIPIAHLHGGEVTEGAFDESIRHSITKISHLHFVAAEEYRRRVIQMGEQPDRVFSVGGLGIDGVLKLPLMNLSDLEKSLDFKFGPRNLLITFHPETLERTSSTQQMSELLTALDKLEQTHFIFTMPNADPAGREIRQQIDDFVASRPHARAFVSLGQLRYLSCVAHVDAVVGNSSSGLIEVPSLKKATLNIGNRQKGRLKADSVIDCQPDQQSINAALQRVFSTDFNRSLKNIRNPYGDGGASQRVVEILERIEPSELLHKQFFDL